MSIIPSESNNTKWGLLTNTEKEVMKQFAIKDGKRLDEIIPWVNSLSNAEIIKILWP